MKIIVRRTRDDRAWIITQERSMAAETKTYKALLAALLAAYKLYPGDEVYIDDRLHYHFGNGLVMLKGDEDLQPVTYLTEEDNEDD